MEAPLRVDEIRRGLENTRNQQRVVDDKNVIGDRITLNCRFGRGAERDDNYILEVNIEYQIRAKRDLPYQVVHDRLKFIFFTHEDTLVVLGSDRAMTAAINVVQEVLYPDPEVVDMRLFTPVTFSVDSVVDTIRAMRDDDPQSWCSGYGGIHGAIRHQNRKTKSDFSLEEGVCVLDDQEAIEAIEHSTAICPRYKFFRCPRLNQNTYGRPKSMLFNGQKGAVTIYMEPEFEDWYGFIRNFLLTSLVRV